MFVVSSTMAVVVLAVVFILQRGGHDTAYIQTVAFMTLIAAQWTNAFNARSEYKSSFSRIKHANYGLLFGFLFAFGSQMLVMFGPLKPVFGIQDVPVITFLIYAGVVALAVLSVVELHKYVVRIIYPNNPY